MQTCKFVLFFVPLFAVAKAQPDGVGAMMGCPDFDIAFIDSDNLADTIQNLTFDAIGGGDFSGVFSAGNVSQPMATALQCLLTAQGIEPEELAAFLASDENVTNNVQVGALWDDVAIIAADLWAEEPRILSALPGFDGIIGLDTDMDAALAGGATFITEEQREDLCGPGFDGPVTSAVGAGLGNVYNCELAPNQHDGFPICFSWPVLPSSIDRNYLLYKRSDGIEFTPNCISTIPNFEYNERHCVVIFDDFFNRKLPDEEGYLYMKELEIVGPLMLVGPDGPVSIEGQKFTNPSNQTAYESGPVFVGARLVPLHDDGEDPPISFSQVFAGIFPNSGSALYASEELPIDTMFRLRTYYSGGMTPDGLTGLTPLMFDRYFTLNFSTGQTLSEAKTGIILDGTNTTVTVLGLADTGVNLEEGYTPCYSDDRDNYIDIILHVTGDATVLQTMLTSFTAFSQQPGLYNPGGPGPFPFESVRYVAPANEQTFPIDVDLNRDREVTYCVHEDGTTSTNVETCISWLTAEEMKQVEQGQIFAAQINDLLALIRSGVFNDASASDSTATVAPTVVPVDECTEFPNSAPECSSAVSLSVIILLVASSVGLTVFLEK